MIPRPVNRRPKPDDWERNRAEISSLYEKRTLKEVMQVMERNGFYATRRMYKSHISQWSLDKNHKNDEMRAMLIKAVRRRTERKESIFIVRNREVSYDEIVHYFKRRHLTVEDVLANGTAIPTPTTVRCLTPPALGSPTLSSISTPLQVAMPEQAIRWISKYMDGSFGSKSWLSITDHEFACSSKSSDRTSSAALTGHMDFLHNKVQTACFLFSKLRFEEGGRDLIAATAGMKELIKLEYPPLLDRLPRTLMSVVVTYPEVAIAILRQFAALAQEYHGINHPFHRFCQILASMTQEDLINTIHAVVYSIRDGFIAALGPFHRSSLAARYTFVRTVCARQGMIAEASGYRDIVEHCAANLPDDDMRILKARTDLALFLQRTGQFEQGRIEAQKITDTTYPKAIRWDREKRIVKLCARGFSCLAGCEYGLGKVQEATVQKEIAVEMYKSLGDEEKAHVIEETFWLEEWEREVRNEAHNGDQAQ